MRLALTLVLALLAAPLARGQEAWLSWRGPGQMGASDATKLPKRWKLRGENDRWSYPLKGRGTPVVDAGGRLFVMGYQGEGTEVRERLVALDAATGKLVWERPFNDFLSDVVYDRYAIGAPAIDPETGHVYAVSAAGLFSAFTRDGQLLWQFSAMETMGRMTFTNARNGAPVIVGDLVITHWMTSNWGGQAAVRDRLYAFDKRTGAPVWAATPAPDTPPKDNSFSTPVVLREGARLVLYTGTGDGHVAALDARTGELLWKQRISQGGVNASLLVDDDTIIAVHGTENIDESSAGRMVALSRDGARELWRLPISSFSSSPVLHAGRVYQVDDTGELWAVEAATGKVAWSLKLARDQVHASPLFADGRLYVPLNDGTFQIIAPGETQGRVLSVTRLAEHCLGAPALWNGMLFVTTTDRLHAFGAKRPMPRNDARTAAPRLASTKPAKALLVRPGELWLKPGEQVRLDARAIDEDGAEIGAARNVTYEGFLPPTAKVRSSLDATVTEGVLTAGRTPSAGALMAKSGLISGTLRGRVLAVPPFAETFEGFSLNETAPDGVKFAHPPLPWLGARMAWEVREVGGRKVLAKTLVPVATQRSRVFAGHPDARDYTVSAEVMSDGNRRMLGDVGVINQRYVVALRGNWQRLEVSSNDERLKVGVPFSWKPGVWHQLVARVEHTPDGTAIIRAKAWKLGDPEPAKWLLEVPHKSGHEKGAPGLYGFAPDGLFRVYVDDFRAEENAP